MPWGRGEDLITSLAIAKAVFTKLKKAGGRRGAVWLLGARPGVLGSTLATFCDADHSVKECFEREPSSVPTWFDCSTKLLCDKLRPIADPCHPRS